MAKAHSAAFTERRQVDAERFAELKAIKQPTLVVNGSRDIRIPTINSSIFDTGLGSMQSRHRQIMCRWGAAAERWSFAADNTTGHLDSQEFFDAIVLRNTRPYPGSLSVARVRQRA